MNLITTTLRSTRGIPAEAGNFRDFFALPNVICCGGSWMAGAGLVQNGRWEEIEELARAAVVDTLSS